MSDKKLQSLAEAIVGQLGPCPISVKLLLVVLKNEHKAKDMAAWEITNQESRVSSLDPWDDFPKFVDQVTWLVFLLRTAGYSSKAKDRAQAFLATLDAYGDKLAQLKPPVMAGVALLYIIANDVDPLGEEATRLSLVAAIQGKLGIQQGSEIEDLCESRAHFFQLNDEGEYPVLMSAWEPLLLEARLEVQNAEA